MQSFAKSEVRRVGGTLDDWMPGCRESTRCREQYFIDVNGPAPLPEPVAEMHTVFPIEEALKARMFEDTDGARG